MIVLDDASYSHLRGLRVFGKSTQNGTPAPTAPVDIVSVGDNGNIVVEVTRNNLLKLPEAPLTVGGITYTPKDGGIECNGTATTAGAYYPLQGGFFANAIPIPYWLQEGKEYILSGACNNVKLVIYFYDENGASISFYDKFTVPSGYKYFGVFLYVLNETTVNTMVYPMICLSAFKNADFGQYTEQKITLSTPSGLHGIPVTSGGNYTVNGQQYICDEVDLERGVRLQRIAKKSFAGVYTWSQPSTWANKNAFVASNLISDAVQVAGYFTKSNIMCNRLGISTPNDISNTAVNVVAQGANTGVYVSVEGITTLEALKAYFAENETYIYYVLAEPIETALTAEEIEAYKSLHTNYPNTTVLNNAGAFMEVSYNADTKTYIGSPMECCCLKDAVTGTVYKLVVSDGKLTMEEVIN